MSALSVPGQQQQSQSPGKTIISRPNSASSLRRSDIEHEDDLVPRSRSRRNSESNASPAPPTTSPGAPNSAAAQAGLVPLPQGTMQSSAENAALTSPVDWKEADHLKATDPLAAVTTLYIGANKRPFHIPTDTLTAQSPYFKKLLAEDTGHAGRPASVEQTSFEDVDEFGMALFMHWLQDHGRLNGPRDFHSLAHYLALYVLARKFEVEGLENQVMDLIRHYYAEQNMTAPAYRLEYIYTYTPTPNLMRTFLINTTAFRALEEQPHPSTTAATPMLHRQTFYGPGSSDISDSIKAALAKNPEMAIDFIDVLVKLHRNGEHDARHGADCDWHVHERTPKCAVERMEPWQSDGPGDEKPPAAADEKPDPPKPAAPGGPVAPTEPKKDLPKPAVAPKPAAAAPKPVVAAPPAAASPAVPKSALHTEEPKTDDGPFKQFGRKMKGHLDGVKDKLHKKPPPGMPDKPAVDKPAAPTAPAAAAAAAKK